MTSQEANDLDAEMKEAFLVEAHDLIEQAQSLLLTIERETNPEEVWDALFRLAHNLKGTGKAVGFDNIASFAHEVENLLVAVRKKTITVSTKTIDLLLESIDQMRKDIETLRCDATAKLDQTPLVTRIQDALRSVASKAELVPASIVPSADIKVDEIESSISVKPVPVPQSDEFIRISLRKIDDLLNNLGEQIILQSTLDQAQSDYDGKREQIINAIRQLNKLTYDIQQTAMGLRMVNLKSLFSKLERAVRDTSKATEKNVEFISIGSEQELDKTIVDALSDAFVHMVRNAVDHGIELPDVRTQQGKSAHGTVRVSASRRGGFFYLEIKDDGRGLDREKILAKAVALGLTQPGANLSDSEVFEFIFENGFSTKDVATDISGRGIGMDVVKQSVLRVKGGYQIESHVGTGTTISIRLPLTLAVFNGMVIRVSESSYVLPNSDIQEVVKVRDGMIREVSPQRRVVRIRDDVYPLVYLREVLRTQHEARQGQSGVIIVANINRKPYAFLADDLVSQQRIVYKTLGREAQGVRGAVGATILGDGGVALILEFSRLVNFGEHAA